MLYDIDIYKNTSETVLARPFSTDGQNTTSSRGFGILELDSCVELHKKLMSFEPRKPSSSSTDSSNESPEASFLRGIYSLIDKGRQQESSVTVMRYIDDLLHAEQFSRCDSLLTKVDVSKLPSRVILAFVTITNGIPRDRIPARTKFLAIARKRLAELVGENRARCLLGDE